MKRRIPRLFFLLLGWFFTLLGLVGIPLPGLPTTPFLLLASYFFMRSSKKFFFLLLKLPVAGPRLKRFLKGYGMTLGEKIGAITLGWLGMGAGWYFGMRDRPWAIYMFAALALVQLIAMIRIKTHKVRSQDEISSVITKAGSPESEGAIIPIESLQIKEDRPVKQSSRIFTSSK